MKTTVFITLISVIVTMTAALVLPAAVQGPSFTSRYAAPSPDFPDAQPGWHPDQSHRDCGSSPYQQPCSGAGMNLATSNIALGGLVTVAVGCLL